MGRITHQAASVGWSEIEEAVKANPHRGVGLQGGSASTSVSIIPTEETITWMGEPRWSEDMSFTVKDGVAISLWIRDPLYRIAAPAIRRSMEMEEASFLLHSSEIAWKQHNGRVRGWVRKHLEEDLRLRAGGGDPAPDAWETIRTTKRAALLLDYICIVRSLRLALWWPDHKAVTVIPLTRSTSQNIVQINCLSGRMLFGPGSNVLTPCAKWPALMMHASSEFVWSAPASAPSIGAQTVAQIHDRIEAMNPSVPHVRTGGRAAIWNRLMWLTLVASLEGKEQVDTEVEPSAQT